MGNTLCKNRVNHSNNSKSPVDRVIGRCAQICPKSLGKQKHFWDKQVLETSPPHQTQPKADNSEWHSATLTVPDSPGSHPVAPPRKKRPSLLRKDDPPVRNGFKEIFAGQRSESTTTSDSQGDLKDFTDFEKMPLNRGSEKEKQKREQLMETSRASSEEGTSDQGEAKTSTLTHKVSKVGNKKSDKFFGENLSDCLSDEHIVNNDDEHVEKIQCSVTETDATATTSLDKTDEAIANSIKESLYTPIADKRKKLDDAEDAIRDELLESLHTFKNIEKVESIDEVDRRVVVEEPLIVKTIVKRHICDDEDELRHYLHLDENDPAYVVPDPNAPKKPQRDFSKYKKNNEDTKSKMEEPATEPSSDLLTQIRKELPSLNTLLASKDDDKKVIDNITADSIVEEITKELNSDMKHDTDTEDKKAVSEPPMKKLSTSEKVLRRQLSSQSYLTPDLVEEIANRVSSHHAYLPEDYSSYSDGSEIAPNSKLMQKRSLSSHSSQSDLKAEKIDGSTKGSSDRLADKVEETAHSPPSTPLSIEPETPPVDTKLTRPDFTSAMNSPMKVDPISTNVDKIPETPVRTRIPRLVKQGPTNEDISNAIKSFMEKDNLRPEDVLLLLEDEFGEYLNSTSLPADDRRLIEDMRMAVSMKLDDIEEHDTEIETDMKDTGEDRRSSVESPIEVPISSASSEDKRSVSSVETLVPDSSAETVPNSSASTDDKRSVSSVETLVPDSSAETVPIHPARQISDEKRRHSIDEFDHWFAGSLSKKLEVPVRKRKRELSLPGYLITSYNSEELENIKNILPDSDSEDDAKQESESDTMTTNTIYTIDTIPEIVDAALTSSLASDDDRTGSPDKIQITEVSSELFRTVPVSLANLTKAQISEKSSESPVSTDTAEAMKDTNQSNTNEIHTNLDDPPHLMLRDDDKRKSVGHSLLLKFLDVERNNSCQ